MRPYLRKRFWLACVVGSAGGVLFLLTLLLPAWIEAVFSVDPDRGSGTLELVVAMAALAGTLVPGLVAYVERRRAAAQFSHAISAGPGAGQLSR
jgi:hypothetical protein